MSCLIFWSAILENCSENGQWPPVIFGSVCVCVCVSLYVCCTCVSLYIYIIMCVVRTYVCHCMHVCVCVCVCSALQRTYRYSFGSSSRKPLGAMDVSCMRCASMRPTRTRAFTEEITNDQLTAVQKHCNPCTSLYIILLSSLLSLHQFPPRKAIH